MKTKPSTPQNHVDANEEIRALKAQISRLEKELDNAQIKVELYNEMINGKNGADCYSKNGHAVTVLTRQS